MLHNIIMYIGPSSAVINAYYRFFNGNHVSKIWQVYTLTISKIIVNYTYWAIVDNSQKQ